MNSIGINYKKMEKEREMDELILVNAEDEEIGYGEKAYVHEKGLLHRAFSVFIVNDGKMLIQRETGISIIPEDYGRMHAVPIREKGSLLKRRSTGGWKKSWE